MALHGYSREVPLFLPRFVSAPSKEFPGFLPLSVDYREHFSAAGKIPGGYFKREGKFSDQEVLISTYLLIVLFGHCFLKTILINYKFLQLSIPLIKIHAPHTLALLLLRLLFQLQHPIYGACWRFEVATHRW